MLRWLFTDAGEVLIHMPPWPGRVRRALAGLGLTIEDERLQAALRAGEAWLSARPHQDVAPTFEAEDLHTLGHLAVVAAALGAPAVDPRYLRDTCYYVGASHAFADAAPALSAVRALGLRTGVISNAPPSLRAVLVRFGLSPLVDAVTLSSDLGIMKPDPRVFRAALDRAGAAAAESVYVDDLAANVDAALAFGFAAAWVIDRDGHAEGRPDRLPDLSPLPCLLAHHAPAAGPLLR